MRIDDLTDTERARIVYALLPGIEVYDQDRVVDALSAAPPRPDVERDDDAKPLVVIVPETVHDSFAWDEAPPAGRALRFLVALLVGLSAFLVVVALLVVFGIA